MIRPLLELKNEEINKRHISFTRAFNRVLYIIKIIKEFAPASEAIARLRNRQLYTFQSTLIF
jgi:hypothetical protein